jgi:hypothetical protein
MDMEHKLEELVLDQGLVGIQHKLGIRLLERFGFSSFFL